MTRPPRIFHLMQLAHRALFRASDRLLQRELGISTVQQGALFVIKQAAPCHPSVIARTLDMNKSAVTTLLSRLEKAQLISRRADPEDARAQLISLTEKGGAAIAKSVPFTKRANAFLLDGFTSAEIETIERFLATVISRSDSAASPEAAHPKRKES